MEGKYNTGFFSVLILANLLVGFGMEANAQNKNKQLSSDQVSQLIKPKSKAIAFVENKGQWPAHVLYRADVAGGQMLATPDGMIVGVFDPASITEISDYDMKLEKKLSGRTTDGDDLGPAPSLRGFGWRLNFVGGIKAKAENIDKDGQSNEYCNYLSGDPSTSATNVHKYNVITYKDVYPGISVKYYTSNTGNLENDIIVKPGAEGRQIRVQIEGFDEIKMDDKEGLILPTYMGKFNIPHPECYLKDSNGNRSEIKVKYRLEGKNIISFDIPDYDKTQTLVIDPIVMSWATWIESTSNIDSHCHGIDLDESGVLYVTGRGGSGLVTVGAFQSTFNGSAPNDYNMWISKYIEPSTTNGSGTCVWQTYLGGSGFINPYACNMGTDGNLYLAGLVNDNLASTYGTGAPTATWTQRTQVSNGQQCFIAKVNTAGTWAQLRELGSSNQSLSPSFYDLRILPTGGSTFDLIAAGYVTQQTGTSANGDIPAATYPNGTAAPAPSFGTSITNGFVLRLTSDLTTIKWAKQYTTSGKTNKFMIANVDGSGNILLAGQTNGSSNVSYNNTSTQTSLAGSADGWLLSLDSLQGNVNWSRYFNSSGLLKTTNILCMELNQNKTQIVIGGTTSGLSSSNISSGAYQATYPGGGMDFFISCLPVAGMSTAWGTYFGGNALNTNDNMMGLNLDQNNDIYCLLYTSSKFTPTTNPANNNPLQTSSYDNLNEDAMFIKMLGSSNGSTLLYYTYLGGKSNEEDPVGERGIKFFNCQAYLAVTSESNDFPLTSGTYDSVYSPTTGTRYLPLVVSMSNPPNLTNYAISAGATQTITCGTAPSTLTASTPSYVIPNYIRNGVLQVDSTVGAFPNGVPRVTAYQWQYSINQGVTWSNIAGATGLNYTPTPIYGFSGLYQYRRIINNDACNPTADTSSVAMITVNNIAAPKNVTASASTLCAGNAFTLTATILSAADTLVWHFPDGVLAYGTPVTRTNVSHSMSGTYYVTEDVAGGCPGDSASVQVNIDTPMTVNLIGTNITCSGQATGSDSVNINGGITPFTFLWNNSATTQSLHNIPAGTYTVTVTDGYVCTATASLAITQPATAISVTTGSNPTVCAQSNASLTASASNGASPVTYSWSGPGSYSSSSQSNTLSNVTAAMAGTYTVTVSDANGCSATGSNTVVVNPLPVIPAITPPATICSSGSVNIQITGSVSGVNYQLYNSATNTAVGSAVAGTGGTINLPTGTISATTSYNIKATNASTACSTTATNAVTATVSSPASPNAQPTNLVLAMTGLDVNGSFLAPSNLGNLQGYIVLRSIASSLPATTTPSNNTTYTAGQTLGLWTVVSLIYNTAAGTKYFTDSLPSGFCGKNVYYQVYSFDTQSTCVTFNVTPLTNSVTYIPVYTWNKTVSSSYTVPTNWTPGRYVVQACDILYFNNGGTDTATNVPATETIAQLNIQSNTIAVLQPAGATTAYTFSGDDNITTGLNIQAGSTLDAGTGVTFSFSATGMGAQINGTIRTANTQGLSGNATSTFTTTNSPASTLGAGCTVTYEASSGTQVVTSRSDYQNIMFINNGTKNLAGNVLTAGTGNTVTITGGIVDAFTYQLSQASPTNLTMTGGTLRMAMLTTILPQLTGTYSITGGTVELYGAGNQILRGTTTYYNLLFSGNGWATLSSAISTGTNEINGNVNILTGDTVDVQAYQFGSPVTTFTMSGGEFRTSHTGDVVPMMGGAYALTAGTVLLYGTTCADSQIIRSNVTYFNVNITGVIGNFMNGNVKQSTGTLTIASGATFYIFSPAIYNIDGSSTISGPGTFGMNADAGLLFDSQYGITPASCGTSASCGNILTVNRTYLPGSQGFLWSY